MLNHFISGTGKTTNIDYTNRNNQKCMGNRGVKGNDYFQYAYKMMCLECGHEYGCNGSDIFQRKCPKCQKGRPGIPF